MKKLILVDSSVWIEATRKNGDETLKAELVLLLEKRRTAMAWPVWVELFQGAKGRREEENLQGWRMISHWLEFDPACWQLAAEVARACQRAGVNVPFGDVLVFACARRHKVELLECDKHFAMICKVLAD